MALSIFLAILLQFMLLVLSIGIGQVVLARLKLETTFVLEKIVFSVPLGLGVIAYGIFFLGIIGEFNAYMIFLWLGGLFLLSLKEWYRVFVAIPRYARQSGMQFLRLPLVERVIALAGFALLFLSELLALIPPAYYDELMYHLQALKIFLHQGRIISLPSLWQANGPFTVEMLFAIGMSLGNDIFPKLVHVMYGVILVLATWAFARRFFNGRIAWLSIAVLLSSPALPIWASGAWIDLGEAVYELLAFYALLIWSQKHYRKWLVVSATCIGLALGSKYLALGTFGVLGVWTFVAGSRKTLRYAVQNAAVFGSVAVTVASPWYLKNWFLLKNPFFPFLFGGVGWSAARLSFLTAYLHSFGVHQTVWDWVLMPVNLYLHADKFATMGLELPGLLFPAVLLLWFVPRHTVINAVSLFTLSRMVLWGIGSLQSRFLLPVFPWVSVMTAYVLWMVLDSKRSMYVTRRVTVWAFVLGAVIAPVLIMGIFVVSNKTYAPVFGWESRDEFLQRVVSNYAAYRFINEKLPDDALVFQLWDGRGYYCDGKCIPDAEQSQWTQLVAQPHIGPMEVAQQLHMLGVTHVLFSLPDSHYFLEHDPLNVHTKAYDFYWYQFRPQCLEDVYRDSAVIISRLKCGGDR